MTDKEIVDRAKDAEKRTGFGELVHSSMSKGVNSAYGIGFIEGMVEYRNFLQDSASKDLEEAAKRYATEGDETSGLYIIDVEVEAFKAGAVWGKEHLSTEVKEVDLEEEFNNFLNNIEGMHRLWHPDKQIKWGKYIAKHFFELGLKTQKGG